MARADHPALPLGKSSISARDLIYWVYPNRGGVTMARPRYSAAKRAREQKQKAKREAKLARKHARKSASTPDEAAAQATPAEPAERAETEGL